MTDECAYDYLYVVEWDESVHRPSYTTTHKIKLNPGVDRQDFEDFMANDGFAQTAAVSTRMGAVVAQHLLTKLSGPPTRLEDLDVDISSFATRSSVTLATRILSWRRRGLFP